MWILSGALFLGAIALLVATAPIFGAQALIVRSGSMVPTMNVGDLAVVRQVSGQLQTGDIISYNPPGHDSMIVTHRITDIQVRDGKTFYVTKGDANNEADQEPVPEHRIIGQPIATVSYIGKVLAFAKTKIGFVLLVIVPGLAIVLADAKAIARELWQLTRKKTIPRLRRGPRIIDEPTLPYTAANAPPPRLALSALRPEALPAPAYWQLPPLPPPRRSKHRVFVDSIVHRLAVLLAVASITIPATQAAYTDSGVSSNNIFSAAEDFGVRLGDVVINEVMWTGAAADGNDEWIELRNMTSESIVLTGWEIINAGSGAGTPIALSGTISPNSYWLLSRFATTSSSISNSITADQVASGISLNNSGEQLTLQDASDTVIDQTPTGSWPAGSLTGGQRRSMERNDPPGDGTVTTNWHTCTAAICNDTTYWDIEGNNHGTPKSINSTP